MSALLQVRDLEVTYRGRRGSVQALHGVSFDIPEGSTLGLVGESGSGKSTIGNAILGLAPVSSGSILFDGRPIENAGRRLRRRLSADLQAIFQNPYGSLNPTRTIASTLGEPMWTSGEYSRAQIEARTAEVIDQVGLPANAADRYPREFSGGQRQRIAIARALMMHPKLIVCDEPVSALDLSIQAQVLNLLMDLKRETGVSLLFISHDLSVVRYLSDSIVVLRRGAVEEQGSASEVYANPQAEYTRHLLASAPALAPRG